MKPTHDPGSVLVPRMVAGMDSVELFTMFTMVTTLPANRIPVTNYYSLLHFPRRFLSQTIWDLIWHLQLSSSATTDSIDLFEWHIFRAQIQLNTTKTVDQFYRLLTHNNSSWSNFHGKNFSNSVCCCSVWLINVIALRADALHHA